MLKIKTKESASWLIGAVAGICMLAVTILLHAQWWVVALAAVLTFVLVSLFALWMMIGYVAYKLKPIYSVVFSRDVHTGEIIGELKDKRVENISEELNAWADDNDKEISRLKEAEKFRKQYLGNVAHELKTPIFNKTQRIDSDFDKQVRNMLGDK